MAPATATVDIDDDAVIAAADHDKCDNPMVGNAEATRALLAPASGRVIPIAEVDDPVFSGEILGSGAAIIPDNRRFVAPVAGTLVTVMNTRHAYVIKTDDGIEVLLHIGIDTVKLKGKGFTVHVDKGQQVAVGDLLCDVDLEVVTAAGLSTTPLVITSKQDVEHVTAHTGAASAAITEMVTFDRKAVGARR